MIIGIDASRANKKERTGTEWYAYYLIQEFKRIIPNHHTVVLYTREPLVEDLFPLPSHFHHKILRWPPRFLWTQLRLAAEMLVHKPDRLFIPAHTIPVIAPEYTITTLHDVGFERYPDLYSGTYVGPSNPWIGKFLNLIINIFTLGAYGNSELDYHRWSARLALRKAKKVLTISEFSKKEILHFFNIPPSKLLVIPLGYNTAFDTRPTDHILNETKKRINLTTRYFLYLGRIEYKKNTDTLIHSFEEYKRKNPSRSCTLLMIGSRGHGYDDIVSLWRHSDETQNIRIVPWLENKYVSAVMHAAEAFVFPSRYEGFGMPILEAMAAGVPVITSDVGAMREVAGDAAILVNPDNPLEIADAMESVTSAETHRKNLIQKGYQRAAQFDWHQTAEKTYKALVG